MSAAILVFLVALPSAALAHSGEESYVYLDIYDDTVEGRVEYPIGDLNEVLSLDLPLEEEAAIAYAEANRQLLHGYAAEHLGLEDASGEWPLVFDGFSVLEIGAAGSYLIIDFTVDRVFDSVPREFTASYDGIFHAKSERSGLLIIGTDWGSGTFNNEASELLRFAPGSTTASVDLGDTSFWKGVGGVVDLGVEHIRIGTDHILFILALVLPSVLVFSRPEGWQAAPSFGSSLWRVLKIVTMFTIAHTITLTLGGLGIINLPG
ncbi:MAG: HupE/UreJ family protein, partial [Acidimicrobiia bacterium]|nr:HupE/UreJ family protein [Acidimicrobiia bacterium]